MQKTNNPSDRNKIKTKSNLEILMNETYKTACMIRDQRNDYYDIKKCLSLGPQSYNKARWYEHIKYASEQCDRDKTVDFYLCERFRKALNELINYARTVRYNTNFTEK